MLSEKQCGIQKSILAHNKFVKEINASILLCRKKRLDQNQN